MEWPAMHAPFTNIIVEDDKGGEEVGGFVGQRDALGDDTLEAMSTRPPEGQRLQPGSRANTFLCTRGWCSTSESQVQLAVHPVAAGEGEGAKTPRKPLRLPLMGSAGDGIAVLAAPSAATTEKSSMHLGRTLQLPATAVQHELSNGTAPAPSCAAVRPVALSARNQREMKRTASAAARRSTEEAASSASAGRRSRVCGRLDEKPETLSGTSLPTCTAFDERDHERPPLPPPTSVVAAATSPAEARRRTMQVTRPSSAIMCFDWWMYLCFYDVHALFTSQTDLFEMRLRPLASASVNIFYAALTHCFASWRQEHWDALVVLRDGEPSDAGPRRRTVAAASGVVRDPQRLEYANAVWYEGLRVQRLMVQRLLQDGHEGWKFEEACVGALRAALGSSPIDTSSFAVAAAPSPTAATTAAPQFDIVSCRKDDRNGVVQDRASTIAEVRGHEAHSAGAPASGLLIRVPSATRMLELLTVLDVLWEAQPASLPFRMPVSEMEAPGYYRSIRDPVSLCQLYTEVFEGIPTPTRLTCLRQSATIASQVLHALGRPDGRAARAIAEEVESRLIGFASLRERLTTMKVNCEVFNGAGSVLSQQASQVVSAGVRALRDAQAEEKGWAASPPQRQRSVYAAATLTPGSSQPSPSSPLTIALSIEELSTGLFKSSEASAVEPPPLRHRELALSAATEGGEEEETFDSEHRRALSKKKRGDCKGSITTRVLQLRAGDVDTSTTSLNTDFWVQCDQCDVWHKLKKRLDPIPDTWTCREIGLRCSRKAKKTRKVQRRTAKRVGRRAEKKQRRSRDAPVTSGGIHPRTGIEGNANEEHPPHRDGSREEVDVPLLDMYLSAAQTEAAKLISRAVNSADGRKRPTRRSRVTQGRKKARVALSTAPPSLSSTSSGSSSSSSASSSSTTSSSSGDDSDDTESSSDRSSSDAAHKSEHSPEAEGNPNGHRSFCPSAKTAAAATTAKSYTHKLPRTVGPATSSTTAAATSRPLSASAAAELERIALAVAEIEKLPSEEKPFDQLRDIKQLERQLHALRR